MQDSIGVPGNCGPFFAALAGPAALVPVSAAWLFLLPPFVILVQALSGCVGSSALELAHLCYYGCFPFWL